MRIILNSDIIHTNKSAAFGLPVHLKKFCQEAKLTGALLVIPRTTLLENRRNQDRLVQEAIASVEAAVQLLASFDVALPTIDAKTLVGDGDMISSLRGTGIQVEIEEPTLEDYRSAENRACLHLPPQPPETKSDEMRDLIIWEIALRIARQDGKALLLSRDAVHSHERGQSEAALAGLLRASNLDEALELLGKESPAGTLTRDILSTIWPSLHAKGVPIPSTLSLKRVTSLNFVTDADGHASGSFDFNVETKDGPFCATLEVSQLSPETIQAKLTRLRLNDSPWKVDEMTIEAKGELPRIAQPENERLLELRTVIGDGE